MIKLASESDAGYLSSATDGLSIQGDEHTNRGKMY